MSWIHWRLFGPVHLGDVLLSCDDDLPLDEAMAEDGCSANVLVVLEQDTPLLSDATGNYEVSQTWSAMDQCGNDGSNAP